MEDAKEMVNYILSVTDEKQEKERLPVKGTLSLDQHQKDETRGQYTLMAVYTDKGGKEVGPLTNTDVVSLRNSKVKTIHADAHPGFSRWSNNLGGGDHKSYILLRNIDLTGIKGFTYEYSSKDKDGEIEVRLDSQAGPVISRTSYTATGEDGPKNKVTGNLNEPITGKHDVYFIAIKRDKPINNIITLSTIEFEQ
jgi:cytochrome c